MIHEAIKPSFQVILVHRFKETPIEKIVLCFHYKHFRNFKPTYNLYSAQNFEALADVQIFIFGNKKSLNLKFYIFEYQITDYHLSQ